MCKKGSNWRNGKKRQESHGWDSPSLLAVMPVVSHCLLYGVLGGNSIGFLLARFFAHDLAPVLARVSKQKGHMYKLLQQVYCGLKIMPREFAPVLAQDFIILLNCHPVRPSGPDTCCQSGCIRGMSTGSHRDRAWKRIPWWSTCPLRCSCWSRRRKSDGSICRALDRSTNYSVQR